MQLKKIDTATERVDKLHAGLLSNSPNFLHVWDVVKKCVILLHGNGRAELVFSINKPILQENTKNAFVVAQRITYEGIVKEGDVLKISVNKEMIDYVCCFNGEYKAVYKLEK